MSSLVDVVEPRVQVVAVRRQLDLGGGRAGSATVSSSVASGPVSQSTARSGSGRRPRGVVHRQHRESPARLLVRRPAPTQPATGVRSTALAEDGVQAGLQDPAPVGHPRLLGEELLAVVAQRVELQVLEVPGTALGGAPTGRSTRGRAVLIIVAPPDRWPRRAAWSGRSLTVIVGCWGPLRAGHPYGRTAGASAVGCAVVTAPAGATRSGVRTSPRLRSPAGRAGSTGSSPRPTPTPTASWTSDAARAGGRNDPVRPVHRRAGQHGHAGLFAKLPHRRRLRRRRPGRARGVDPVRRASSGRRPTR